MPHESDALGNEVRKSRHSRRLPERARCACGEDRPEALEVHHPAGHANAPDLEAVRCKNCHATDTEAQRDVGADLRHKPDRTVLELVEAGLRSLASFLESLAQQMFIWADQLLRLIRELDTRLPGWRLLPGACI